MSDRTSHEALLKEALEWELEEHGSSDPEEAFEEGGEYANLNADEYSRRKWGELTQLSQREQEALIRSNVENAKGYLEEALAELGAGQELTEALRRARVYLAVAIEAAYRWEDGEFRPEEE